MSDKAPSAWKIEQALATWNSARRRILEDDSELARDEGALAELLGEEEGNALDVLERLGRAARHAETMAEAAATRVEEISERQKRYKARAQTMRGAAFAMMEALEIKKHETAEMTFSVRAGQQSVIVTDEAKVPDIYVRIERKIDKATIKSALLAGQTVDGAALTNGLPSLSLRVK